jgi:hypothetical protein
VNTFYEGVRRVNIWVNSLSQSWGRLLNERNPRLGINFKHRTEPFGFIGMCAMNPNCFCYCNFCCILQFIWCRKISPQSSGRLLNEWKLRLQNHSIHEMGPLCLIQICAMSANLSQPQLLVVYYFIFMCRQSPPQSSGRLLNEWNLGQRNH